jgi:hypothetical protein
LKTAKPTKATFSARTAVVAVISKTPLTAVPLALTNVAHDTIALAFGVVDDRRTLAAARSDTRQASNVSLANSAIDTSVGGGCSAARSACTLARVRSGVATLLPLLAVSLPLSDDTKRSSAAADAPTKKQTKNGDISPRSQR